jgi:hypothetical protein
MAVRIAIGTWLISIGYAMDGETLKVGSRIPLLLQSVLDRGRGRIVTGIGRVAESHFAKALIHSAINTLSPRQGLWNVGMADECSTGGCRAKRL